MQNELRQVYLVKYIWNNSHLYHRGLGFESHWSPVFFLSGFFLIASTGKFTAMIILHLQVYLRCISIFCQESKYVKYIIIWFSLFTLQRESCSGMCIMMLPEVIFTVLPPHYSLAKPYLKVPIHLKTERQWVLRNKL